MNTKTDLEKREKGLPILKQTLCKTGNHVFIFATSSAGSQIPPDDLRCNCGMYRYEELVNQREE